MKFVPFNYDARAWDSYKAFHWRDGLFTQFETGEVILTDGAPHPYKRRVWGERGVSIVATNDHWCPTLYTDKERSAPVSPTWLNQGGQQYIVIDHAHNVAVRLDSRWKDANKQSVPQHLKHAAAIWMRPDQKPLSLRPFQLSLPDKKFRLSIHKKLRDVRAAVTAAVRLQGASNPYSSHKMYVDRAWVDAEVSEIVADVMRDRITAGWCAHNGWEYPRLEVECAYLYTKEGE